MSPLEIAVPVIAEVHCVMPEHPELIASAAADADGLLAAVARLLP